jgi:hypothetical protein
VKKKKEYWRCFNNQSEEERIEPIMNFTFGNDSSILNLTADFQNPISSTQVNIYANENTENMPITSSDEIDNNVLENDSSIFNLTADFQNPISSTQVNIYANENTENMPITLSNEIDNNDVLVDVLDSNKPKYCYDSFNGKKFRTVVLFYLKFFFKIIKKRFTCSLQIMQDKMFFQNIRIESIRSKGIDS